MPQHPISPGQAHAAVGDNSTAGKQLRSIVERIERLAEEKQTLADDIKEIYAEAKGNGFDTKTLRRVVAARKKDASERQEADALFDLYMHALGLLPETPLETAINGASATFAKSLEKLGTPAALTDEEAEAGYSAAFVTPRGQRMTVGIRSHPADNAGAEAAQ